MLCPKCWKPNATRDNVDGVYHVCTCGYHFMVIPQTTKQLIQKDKAEIYYLERRLDGQNIQKEKGEKKQTSFKTKIPRWNKSTL